MNLQIAVSQLRRTAKMRKQRIFFFFLHWAPATEWSPWILGRLQNVPKTITLDHLGAQKAGPEDSLGKRWAKKKKNLYLS